MEKQKSTSGEPVQRLNQMYVRTEHWISDDEFYADEFRFLINLTDKYFIGALIADAGINARRKETVDRLLKLDQYRASIAKQNKEHQEYLARLIQGKALFDPEECVDRQADLESDQTLFLKKYRLIKKEIFQLSEELLGSARSQKLVS